ncbi:hypothetical protein NTHI1209_00259 [Haemophilus influenzae]|uniref:Uncharacterized protein n=1 Tax=Haemophilus influenzae TaxID=727 RepID=A0A158SUW3_HAEIF|nr:hypothetical protein NTHI1209_00259 [Haemophilus influenzae]
MCIFIHKAIFYINNKTKMDKIFHFVHFICISAIYSVFAKFLIKVLNSLPNFS